MTLRKTSLLVAAIVALSTPVLAQGAGGGAGGGSAASSSSSSAGTGTNTGTAATTGGTQQPANAPGTTGTNQAEISNRPNHSSAPAGSPTALQAQRNAGAGTAPNGLPIGAPGSGVGSPEHPVDSGTR